MRVVRCCSILRRANGPTSCVHFSTFRWRSCREFVRPQKFMHRCNRVCIRTTTTIITTTTTTTIITTTTTTTTYHHHVPPPLTTTMYHHHLPPPCTTTTYYHQAACCLMNFCDRAPCCCYSRSTRWHSAQRLYRRSASSATRQ